MKIQHIIPLLLLAGSFAANAQTTNAVSNTNTPSLLTKDQAEKIALRLADEKVEEERKGYAKYPHYPVFEQNLNKGTNDMFKTSIKTRYLDGHWEITLWTMDAHDRHFATVELAGNGSTNSVVYRREGGLP